MPDSPSFWTLLGWFVAAIAVALAAGYLLHLRDRALARRDERPDDGLDILPWERGTNDDATEEQLDAGMRLLRQTPARADLADPDDDDPYEDITYAEAFVAPSPTLGARAWREAPTHPGRPLHKHGRPKGDLTLLFEGIAFHEGHEVAEHGPDEDTRVLFVTPPVRKRQIGWGEVVTR